MNRLNHTNHFFFSLDIDERIIVELLLNCMLLHRFLFFLLSLIGWFFFFFRFVSYE